MSIQHRTNQFKRRDHCPQCGDIDFLCTEYISDNQVYMYEEQCPRCYDFWQIGLEDTFPNQRKLAKDSYDEDLLR
ncbi:hypothetical protein CGH21_21640 [Vibrio parahaemolyticus]|nr:hypothetical protein CGJ08_16120 [Vibrio parahaemolyticus]TOH68100.1 hypothetical protein CGI75_21960 [Vibrio parahaemolyticus]TOM93704.1 hypothetical protein CGH66_24615 [Vibrio parahaemolyticus]TON06992.1 hypothetical protein CGH67_10885 [Vibrio parahaemolyticus]TON15291.1 hypothetical protein CGH64_18480 [Vibrio parahaemolyticus]